MRKSLLISLLSLFSYSTYSQGSWLDVGLKGGYGIDFLINKNIADDDTHEPQFSFGNMFGGKIGWNFNDEHAINFDIVYSKFGIAYEYLSVNTVDSTSTAYNKNFSFNSLDFLLLYRHVKNASYFEIGPQFSRMKKAVMTDEQFGTTNDDISTNLVPSYYSLVVGAGGFLAGSENMRITLGFRVMYTFDDILSKQGKTNYFPSGVNYDVYNKSNPISVMAVLELEFDVGFLATSNCKKNRTSLVLFK